jgi:hypothetical protein
VCPFAGGVHPTREDCNARANPIAANFRANPSRARAKPDRLSAPASAAMTACHTLRAV